MPANFGLVSIGMRCRIVLSDSIVEKFFIFERVKFYESLSLIFSFESQRLNPIYLIFSSNDDDRSNKSVTIVSF